MNIFNMCNMSNEVIFWWLLFILPLVDLLEDLLDWLFSSSEEQKNENAILNDLADKLKARSSEWKITFILKEIIRQKIYDER